MHIVALRPHEVSEGVMEDIVVLASKSFHRHIDDSLRADCKKHVIEANQILLAYKDSDNSLVAASMARALPHLDAIEFQGCIIHPERQRGGFALKLMHRHAKDLGGRFVVGHARNPSIIAVMADGCDAILPIDEDSELREVAAKMPGSIEVDGVIIQSGRYEDGGPFSESDPARRKYRGDTVALKERFPVLQNRTNALVVVGRLKETHTE